MDLKKKIAILCSIIVVLILAAIIIAKSFSKNYLIELKYQDVIDKIENKESFVICISQTECTHCQSYKPKLAKVAKEYKINIYYIDIDLLSKDEKQKFNKYISITGGTPSTVFIKEGEEKTSASRINGDVSTSKIIKKLQQNNFIK